MIVSPTKFGRFHVAEPMRSLFRRHTYTGLPLRVADHEPKIGVLDQEDLEKQGINTSLLVPGAPRVDALGSCTANTGTEALSNVLDVAAFNALTGCTSYSDTVHAEEFAIKFYHNCTDLTKTTTDEWPPTDCGSSGPYIVELMEQMKIPGTTKPLIASEQVATGATNIISLMQSGGLMTGLPFLNAWMEPGPTGFVDGNGSVSTLEAQIQGGVAGGHEVFLSAVEKVMLLANGEVDPQNTVVRFRNHWTATWGDHGSGRFHLSTLVALANYMDFRQVA